MRNLVKDLVAVMFVAAFILWVFAFAMVNTVATPEAIVKTVRQRVIDDFNKNHLPSLLKDTRHGQENG